MGTYFHDELIEVTMGICFHVFANKIMQKSLKSPENDRIFQNNVH